MTPVNKGSAMRQADLINTSRLASQHGFLVTLKYKNLKAPGRSLWLCGRRRRKHLLDTLHNCLRRVDDAQNDLLDLFAALWADVET